MFPMNEEIRLRRAATFDQVAELYDSARRELPGRLFDRIFEQAGMEPSRTRVLEVGCGTGQATLPLARRGCNVVAVEIGENLAGIARRKTAAFPNVQIVHGRFEDFQPEVTGFDLVLAVTSWHWIDPNVRYSKAAEVLRPGGVLAFTSGGHVFPADADPLFAQIHACYEAVGIARMDWPPPGPENMQDSSEEIRRSGHFENPSVTRDVAAVEFTAEQYVSLMSTASDHRLMEPEKREWLLAEMRRIINSRPGGRILRHSLTMLHMARKPSGV